MCRILAVPPGTTRSAALTMIMDMRRKRDKDGVGSVKPCKHLEFMFVGACADFEHRSKRFEKAWGKAAEADEDFEHCFDRDALGAMGYDETLVVFEVTTSGMACGPVSDTVSYGFQMEVE